MVERAQLAPLNLNSTVIALLFWSVVWNQVLQPDYKLGSLTLVCHLALIRSEEKKTTLFIPDRRFTCALNLSGLKRGQLLVIYYSSPAIISEESTLNRKASSMLNNVLQLLNLTSG